MKYLNKQIGISLVEVLVALVISLFLLAGIVQVYAGNKATFTFTNALAEVQENGRFALDIMSQDMRLANEWGCIPFNPADTSNINNTLNGGTVPGYNANWHDFTASPAITGTNNLGLNGSDTVTIRGGKPGAANVESPFYPVGTARLTTTSSGKFAANDIVLITRCGANDLLIAAEADIMRITTSTSINANTQTDLTFAGNKSQQYQNDASMIELQTVTYSVENSLIVGVGPTLIRTEFGVRQELIEGVGDMQVLYGIDSDNDQFPNQYVSSNNVPNFGAVVSMRIMLLVRSADQFVTDVPQIYTFNGVTGPAGDRRLYQVFSTTVALRNRIGP